MSRRFGGRYSPNGPRQTSGQTPVQVPPTRPEGKARGESRLVLLFLASMIFPLRSFFGDATWLLQCLGATGLILAGLFLTRDGMRAHEAYDSRKIARRPVLPRKIIGSILLGAGLGLGAYASGVAPITSGLLAALGALLHLSAFGPDPMSDKGMTGIDAFQTDRVANAIEEGERLLAQMRDAALRAGDRAIEARVEDFSAAAARLFRQLEASPANLTAVRKYLSVYLTGARDATVKFVDHYALTHDEGARSDYLALLGDLQTTFASRTEAMLTAPNTDLDVEIAVLRDRLKYDH